MECSRRRFLAGIAALATGGELAASSVAVSLPELLPRSKGRRAVVVGGGWGGLSAARHLRALAPDLEVVLVEKNPIFHSLPLSNKWLADLVETRLLVHDYAAAARAFGYVFVQAEVQALDRERRRVVGPNGTLEYDWLVLAPGIREDYAAWFGDDHRAADHARRHFGSVWQADGGELARLKRKLADFAGGDLLMCLPPSPYRCPLAPYERASLVGWLFKSRGVKGRLIVVDPNPGPPAFRRIFSERHKDRILYVSDARVTAVDPYARRLSTEFEEFRFDDAILMPPQQAGDLLWQADLIGRDRDGRPTGWADHDAVRLNAREDERVFVVGDALGAVSPLFGHYPKTGHAASRQGRIVAAEIAARAQGREAPKTLPESLCYVFPDFEPLSMVRSESRYRFRGDGLIEQTTRQFFDPNPRGEDIEWAKSMFAEFLAYKD